ncbi:DUF4145 domain-containing protein [Hoeflea sp.]|uniref:DUF4145 domain-containing protein n=1 Tax=Hoeflea sp. TaxID=1940281 RepID=UPI0019ADB8C7|nr:DUF4145 domain-containing protein [Hoeflea sp.]MBC7280006.1 DUF4145 domain-containing protein [Hoeflea sp.]
MPAYLVDKCPHCRGDNQSLRIIGFTLIKEAGLKRPLKEISSIFGGVVCNSCQEPSAVEVWLPGASSSLSSLNAINDAKNGNSDIALYKLTHEFVPTPGYREPLPGLPAHVQKSFTQAETAFDILGMEEPAAMAYRRTVEQAINHAHSGLSGDLVAKITQLANTQVIPHQMADWAHQVRIIGNSGAHDEFVKRSEVEAARAFADAFLRYLIVLPDQVATRRRETGTDAPTTAQGNESVATD